MNFLDRWRDGGNASPEKQRMLDALARLKETRAGQTPPAKLPAGLSPALPRAPGRLMMALDLTGSREHSLKQARIATAAMLDTIKSLGAVLLKLVYFRGGYMLGQGECRASGWCSNPDVLCREMRRLSCKTGYTNWARVLRLALAEREAVAGIVVIGDQCEEDGGELRALAGSLGRKGIPLFVFHEITDYDARCLEAKPVFEGMAEASAGVYVEFKTDAGETLKEILAQVAAFAAGGAKAVQQMAQPVTAEARQLQTRLLLGPASGNGGDGK